MNSKGKILLCECAGSILLTLRRFNTVDIITVGWNVVRAVLILDKLVFYSLLATLMFIRRLYNCMGLTCVDVLEHCVVCIA